MVSCPATASGDGGISLWKPSKRFKAAKFKLETNMTAEETKETKVETAVQSSESENNLDSQGSQPKSQPDQTIQHLSVETIEALKELQARQKMDDLHVERLREPIAKGDKRRGDPVMVFKVNEKNKDGKNEVHYYLADGFHWLAAAKLEGKKRIEVTVREGTRSDALKYAIGVNSSHGLPRSTADKERAIRLALADAKLSLSSTATLARVAQVSQSLVARVRAEWEKDHPTDGSKRVGADGKTRKASITRKAGNGEREQKKAAKEAAVALASSTPEKAESAVIKPKKGQVDDLKGEIPENLRAAFGGVVELNGIVNILGNVLARVKMLRDSGTLTYGPKAIESNLRVLIEDFNLARPAVVDPDHKNGFMSAGQYDALKAQEKRDLYDRLHGVKEEPKAEAETAVVAA